MIFGLNKNRTCLDGKAGDALPVVAIVAATLFWGGSFSAMRVSVQALGPWSVMWFRMIVALLLLVPFAGRLWPSAYRPGDWKLLLPMALFQPCLYFFFESSALQFTTSSQAGVIAAAVPLMVAFAAWLSLSETISKGALLGMGISIAGVAGLTLLQGSGSGAQHPLLGNSLEMLAMASAAVSMVLVKRLSARYNPWTLTGLQTLAGAVFFLPGAPGLFGSLDAWTPQVIVSMLFLGTFVTLGAFGLYNWGMSRLTASRASVFINLVPVFAVAFGWTLLGEALNPLQCLAAAAVIAGVWLGQHRARHAPAPAAAPAGLGVHRRL
ncbi:MAG: DMT family transporter [Desulfobacterales bacterium]|nr:DMT family transporter [Desulfobacterales bacterium]